MTRTTLTALTLAPLLLACQNMGGNGASLDLNDVNVTALTVATQGPYVDAAGVGLIAAFGDETGCPSVTGNETTSLIQGGCTDEEGQVWTGEVRVSETFIEFVDFGVEGVNITSGTITLEENALVADYSIDGVHSVAYANYIIETNEGDPGAFYGGIEAGGLPQLDVSGAFFPCDAGTALSMDVSGGDEGNLAVELDQCRESSSWSYGTQSGTLDL